MKKLLTNKKLMSMLSLVLVVAMMITNINLGGVRAKAETGADPNMLSLTKTVTSIGNDKYNVDLATEGHSIKNETNNITDVVLVLDVSRSMNDNGKLGKMKEAAKTFVNTVKNNKNIRVSVVTYSDNTVFKELTPDTRYLDWSKYTGNYFVQYNSSMGKVTRYKKDSDIFGTYYKKSDNGSYAYGYWMLEVPFGDPDINDKIDDIFAYGATNTHSGLAKAEEILNSSNAENKIVVLLSDGAPTFSYRMTSYNYNTKAVTNKTDDVRGTGNHSSLYVSNYYYDYYDYYDFDERYLAPVTGTPTGLVYVEGYAHVGDSSYNRYRDANGYYYVKTNSSKSNPNYSLYVDDNEIPAKLQAQSIKSKGAKIYSIAYCDDSVANFMKSVATSDEYFRNTPNADDIKSTFENIAKEISFTSVPEGTFTDKVPAYIKVLDANGNKVENGKFEKDGKTFTVSTDAAGVKTVTTTAINLTNPADEKTVTTHVAFNIELDKDYIKAHASEFIGKTELPTNLAVAPGQYAKVEYTKSSGTAGQAGATETAYASAPGMATLNVYQVTVNYYEDQKDEAHRIGKAETFGVYFSGDECKFGNFDNYNADKYSNIAVTGASKDGSNYKLTVTGNNTVDIVYTVKEFTVKYFDGVNAKAIKEQTVKYGQDATDPISELETEEAKAAKRAELEAAKGTTDASQNFSFTGWDKDGKNITTNTAITALYSGTDKTFTVRFFANADDVSPVATQTVTYGGVAVVPGVRPEYNGTLEDNVLSKEFDGWDFVFTTKIYENKDIYAKYKDNLKTYTVQFAGLDGNIISRLTKQNVAYGSTVEEPTLTDEEKKNYKNDTTVYFFNGWNWDFDTVLNNDSVTSSDRVVTIYANTDSSAPRYYKVKWLNNNGDVLLQNEHVEYGSDISYTGNTPEYQFVTGDNPGEYTITFTGWDNNTTNGAVTNVQANVTLTAKYSKTLNKYTYTFKYWDAEGKYAEDVREDVAWGTKLTPPDVLTYVTTNGGIEVTHSFGSWSDDAWDVGVKADNLVATASQNTLTKCRVTFNYANGSKEVWVVSGSSVPAAEVPSGDTLKKNDDNTYTYTFKDWSGENVAKVITGPTTFTADYTPTYINYTLTVKYAFDGTVVTSFNKDYTNVHYNEDVIIDEAPETQPLNNKKYHLTGYASPIVVENGKHVYKNLTSNTDVIVNYAEDDKFEVTYHSTNVSFDTETLGPIYTTQSAVIGRSDSVYTGDALTGDGITEAVAAAKTIEGNLNAKYSVEFVGWVNADGSAFTDTIVTTNKDVYAKYAVTTRKYTVKFMDAAYKSDDVNSQINYTELEDYTVEVEYGKGVANVPPLTKDTDTAKFTYADPYWDITDFSNITGTVTAYAQRPRSLKSYKVTYVNYDGTVLNTEEIMVPYGGTTDGYTEPGRTDSKDGHFFYVFDGWTVNGAKVNFPYTVYGTTTMAAVYTEHEHTFSVAFIDSKPDGTTLNFDGGAIYDTVVWGQTVTTSAIAEAYEAASQSAISRSNKVTTWTFVGFKELVYDENGKASLGADFNPNAKVEADATYVATYTDAKNTYNFVYLNDKVEEAELPGEVTKSQIEEFVFAKVPTPAGSYETTPAAVRADGPAKGSTNTENFTFIGWKLFAGTVVDDDPTPAGVGEPVEEAQTEKTPAPTQDGESDEPLSIPAVLFGSEASVTRVAHITLDANTSEEAVTAPDSDAIADVIVRESDSIYVTETINGEELIKALKFVDGDVYLVPVYASSTRTYKVDFVDYDGTVLKTEQVEFEHAATAPANPTRGGYTFTGWDKDFSKITTDLTVNAKYQANGGGYYIPPTPTPTIDTGDDETPQGSIPTEDPQIIVDGDDETPQGSIPETQQDMELPPDEQALGDALVKTGTVPVAVYYGFGATLMLVALFLAFRKKREEA